MIVMTQEKTALVAYLDDILEEKRLSQRALAMYAGVASSTISRIMSGGEPDPATLIKLADYLNVPVKTLFQKAGWLREEEAGIKSELLAEIEHLMRMLPEESQRRIRDQARLEFQYKNQSDDEPEPVRTAT
jgi:transcriptional regulator with XRE-family HTH domain